MKRKYYGFAHTYGQGACDRYGESIGDIMIFGAKSDRDAWVESGPAYSTEPGFREKLSSRKIKWEYGEVLPRGKW